MGVSSRSLVLKEGRAAQAADDDTVIVGSGIDVDASAGVKTLNIGTTSAEDINIGRSGQTVSVEGDLDVQGAITVVTTSEFQQDATFLGNVSFGDVDSPADDTVSFANALVNSDVTFDGAGHQIKNLAAPTEDNDAARKVYVDDGLDLKLDLAGGTMSGAIAMGSNLITGLSPGVAGTDAANVDQVNAIAAIKYDQELFVAKNGSDTTGTGAVLKPFATVGAAMAAITDASVSKRYAIRVETGAYTEASALNLKPNVFIIGVGRDAVRITAPSYGLDASFTGGADNRSGISNAILNGAASFDFTTVTSTAGKLYFRDTTFASAVTLTGYNNATVQAQISGCQIIGVFTVQGVNVGVFNDNICWSNIVLTQSPFGGVPTILTATGGACSGTVTATTTVNDFNRRISIFARSFWMNGAVTIDGPSSYLDYTVDSLPSGGASTPNGGNLVSIDYGANKALSNLVFPTAVNSPIMPASTSATNFGDWGKQWAWSFAWLHASTGSDCYLASYPSAFGSEGAVGKNVYVFADAGGLAANISGGIVGLYTNNATGTGASGGIEVETGTAVNGNSGDITLTTGAVSGTGTRGQLSISARQVDVGSVKIVNVANGVNANDAVNKSQLDNTVASFSGGTTGLTPSTATTGAVTLGGTLAVDNGGTGLATAPTNGQLLIGNGTGYTLATLSEGTGIEITESAGSITIAATGAAASTSVEVPLTTTSLSNGDVVCVDTTADNKVKKADADDMDTARVLGVVSAAGKVQVSGIALAAFAAAPTLGAVAYLSNTEGVLTTTKPTSGVVSEVGIVVSATATSGKYSVLLQVKTPIQLVD